MAKDPADLQGTKIARQFIGRRGIDLTRADIRVMHGVLYVKGQVAKMRGFDIPSLRAELEAAGKILRTKQEIKDVVIEVTYRE
ncbi:MAG: hypothetical protein ACOYON_07345 [Fimbriimonas sp.]